MPVKFKQSYAKVWRTYRRVPVSKIPYKRRPWVLDRGSLTKRLIAASDGDFKVLVTSQQWAKPQRDEQQLLGLALGQHALIREVSLICGSEVWVKARSIIPVNTLTGPERQLACLGERPLGAFLFKARTMHRGPLQISSVKSAEGHVISARRSIFFIHNKPILVSEFFMPEIFER
ncbi:MAG: chorismate--pyruvate lyase family protein [Oleiphilus sp.]